VAKVKNAFQTYDAKGNREDLSNAIYNIDPFDTPIMSMCKRRRVRNRSFDWQTEQLPAAQDDNAQEEGFVLDRTAGQATVRETNVTQISKRDATVTGSQEASDAAGKGSEMAHQMAMQSKRLKSDMEKIMTGLQGRADGSSTSATAGVARKTESISHWLARTSGARQLNEAKLSGNKLPGSTNNATIADVSTAGDLTQFTEVILGDGMQKAYEQGGKPSMMYVDPGQKRGISSFNGRTNSRVQIGKSEIVETVDIIVTDFGNIKVMPTRWYPKTTKNNYMLLLDPMYVACAMFRPFMQKPIARIGDAETRMILTEWGVEMRNPLAHIIFWGYNAANAVGSS